jgi:hypothetical protein
VFTGTGALEISGGSVEAAINGFAFGDTIDLQNLVFTGSGTTSFDASDDVLTVTEGGSSIALSLPGSYTDTPFNLSADAGSGTLINVSSSGTTNNLPCFVAGTRIATERGEIAVEHLAIGDHLATVEGDRKPITWIGSRRVDCRHHPEPTKVWPVRIAAQAFGPALPERDLLLSPDHAIFADGVLIPVKYLINGTTIRQIVMPAVSYFHVELDRHAVILAEGLPVESYLDTGDRCAFESAKGPMALYPAFGSDRADIALVMEALGCAPLRVTGPEVAAVVARLACHAHEPEPSYSEM